jgi:hypothetical protein
VANEITFSSLTDATVSEVLTGDYLRLAASRAALPNHSGLYYAGSTSKRGGSTLKVPAFGLDAYDVPTGFTANENDAVSNTALTDDSYTITVARMSKAYEVSDLARFTDAHGILNAERFAQDAIVTRSQFLVQLIASLVGGFSDVKGTSGSDASVATHIAAKNALEARSIPGPYLAVYHSTQWNDIINDMYLNAGGAVQFDPASVEAQKVLGEGYKGRLAGVDVFVTNRVPTANAGADRAGGMFGRGAIGWADMAVESEDPINQLAIGGTLLFERDRTAREAETAFVMHTYLGASEFDDDSGVSIITDA